MPFFSETCDITLGPFSNHIERYHNDIANYLVKRYKIKFAIVNSFESRGILKSLSKNSIPSVFLMHEFYAYLAKDEFLPALTWASSTVFSAKIVQESAITAETHSIIADSYLLPQGKAKIPCIEKIQH
ncbi:MAG: hypothetical protein HWD59_12815 [Coxiellaceae bacterium]|nr:MAG: hypothetical protein HWD59_12815 [Coxiellaceae bacterium]